MLSEFRSQLDRDYPYLHDRKLLLACSGGVDSMVLLHLLRACGLDLAVAHCNFQLRGEASADDAQFVRASCESLGIRCLVRSFDTVSYVESHRGSVQMAARTLRYTWFRQLMETEGYDLLITAHHLDDQIETFLINLSRGSGLQGLSGIPTGQGNVIRPLLSFPRSAVLEYAGEHGIQWREDASNEDDKYLRNRVRMNVLPELRSMHPAFDQNFLRTLDHLKGSNELLQHYREHLLKTYFREKGETLSVRISDLRSLDPIEDYLYLLFSPFGFREPAAIRKLFTAENSKGLYSHTHRLLRDREQLLIAPLKVATASALKLDLDNSGIRVKAVAEMGALSKDVIFVDKEKLNGPFYLKKWEKGDYFYPFGMKGKQKLSKYFKDHKFDPVEKEEQWLLCSGEDIVWIVGHRADDRFRVDDNTREILKITCQQ